MISLYEGILRGMEDTLSDGGVAAAVIAANEPNSDFRKMFSGADYGDAFSMTEENGKNVFTVTTNSSNGSWIECSKHKLSDLFDGVETVKIIGGARIIAPDNNIKDALNKNVILPEGYYIEQAGQFENEEEALKFSCKLDEKICIVSQTTFNYNKFKELVEIFDKKGYDISVVNTICNATEERQTEAKKNSS